ncbi:P-loop containing nucleoside triphosphate hydrolase protein, partial [Mycena sanguinolenta]
MASSNLSDSEYAHQRKALLTLINRLRSVGAQGELDLPRIAVIGNQSAGKSSVVEAISGINVPRDSGTCTRCPLECRLASAPEWACRISIRREFDFTGKRLADMMLRRAQLAVLDPGADIVRIMRMNLEEIKEKMKDGRTTEFSRNVVCIDLEGPDLTDVQFVDLPGIIQNASPAAIRLVEDMVVDNIRGNCLILVAIPMTDDIENQKAMTLAREQDPNGLRTIGVLTKPDLLSAGQTTSRALWHDVIMGYKHPLHHGYFCTRQPDDKERTNGIIGSEARRIEAEFFANSDPWSTCPEQDRLGTDNLISTLSNCLVQMISETLPRISRTADTHLEACRTSLAALPEPPTEDPATHLLTLITEFSNEIKQWVQGSPGHNELVQKNNAAFRDFKVAIKKTAPGFVAGLPLKLEGTSSVPYILTDGGGKTGGGQTASESLQPIYLSDVRETLQRARTRELPGDVPPAAKAALIADFHQTWSRSTEICFERARDSLNEVLSRAMEHFFSRFSNLKRTLWTYLRKLVLAHSQDCNKYLEAVVRMETATPMTQNDDVLQTAMEKWIVKYKDQRAGRIPTDVPIPAAVPKPSPFGFSKTDQPPASTFFSTSTPKPAEGAASTANPAPSGFFTQPPAGTNPAAANPFATPAPRLKQEDFGRLHAGDEYETEILLMSGVRAYFEAGISYRRVIDNVPGLIDTTFGKTFASNLQGNLIRELKLGQPDAHEQCAQYLNEDPAVVSRRTELRQRLKMLESVQKDLMDFGNNHRTKE